jgi:hypothetical protein
VRERLAVWCGSAALLLGFWVSAAAGAQKLPPTHGMALDSVAVMTAGDLLTGVTIPGGRPVVLVSPAPGDTLGLLTQRLVERLRGEGTVVRLVAPGADLRDSAYVRSSGDAGPLRLNVAVDGAGVTYTRRVGKFPFGTKGYERLAAMRATATLIDPVNGEVFWTKSSARSATDLVRKGDVLYAASGSGRLNPAVPHGGTRWLEPMIVVGVVAGLVVLFYSNRN